MLLPIDKWSWLPHKANKEYNGIIIVEHHHLSSITVTRKMLKICIYYFLNRKLRVLGTRSYIADEFSLNELTPPGTKVNFV